MFKKPKHIAIIMDGNGRWAKATGRDRFWGHLQGANTARTIIEEAASSHIENLTLFAFSTENWFRPVAEVSFLMKLLVKHLKKNQKLLMKENIRFQCIGSTFRLPAPVREVLQETIDLTAENTGMNLVFALSYGGREELKNAVKEIASRVKSGHLDIGQIDENLISNFLDSSFLPDPDLIIRTSGETRISNFFLWQAAYSELYFVKKNWPEFTETDFQEALEFYAHRERRYGRLTENNENPAEEASSTN